MLIVAGILIFRYFAPDVYYAQKGRFYVDQVMSLELIEEWKMSEEKMLEEEKQKYGRGKQGEYQLSIRPLKDTRWQNFT